MKNIKFFAVITALFLFAPTFLSAQDTVHTQIVADIKRIVGTDSITPEEMKRILFMLNYRIKATETLSIPKNTKGVVNGVAPLDATGKVPVVHIPVHGHVQGDVINLSSDLAAIRAKAVADSLQDVYNYNYGNMRDDSIIAALTLQNTVLRDSLSKQTLQRVSEKGSITTKEITVQRLLTKTAFCATCVAVGENTLQQATGNYNASVGLNSLSLTTTGDGNSAFGTGAMYSNRSGRLNTAIGVNTMLVADSSQGNSLLGYSVLRSLKKGDYNIGIGYFSLGEMKTGNYNIGIGFRTFIEDSLSHVTVIGTSAVGKISNTIVLGTTENVGVGTSTPSNKMEVAGNVKAISFKFSTLPPDVATDDEAAAVGIEIGQMYRTGNVLKIRSR